jgi:hypothetical protein
MAAERRNPRRHRDVVDSRRATDPHLTTRDCANRLGVSTGFIVGEIRDGRLAATVLQRDGYRTVYRIAPAQLEAYIARHGWTADRAPAG